MRLVFLTFFIVATFTGPLHAQYGYGIRGAGGLRANSIMGSGGLRGNSILGSGGLAGNGGYGGGLGGMGMYRSAFTRSPNGGFGSTGTAGSSRKPFSSYTSQPTVSPYLNLFRTDLSTGGNFNYSTLVQPQLQQQQLNEQLERQTLQNNRRLSSIAAQANFNPLGSKDEYPTGHQTVFNYTGRYFPAAQPRQKRQASQR